MPTDDLIREWQTLAANLKIQLPVSFTEIPVKGNSHQLAWKFLSAAEALSLQAELDTRFTYPEREWRGIPFACSTVSEDVACFDLTTPTDQEARVLPIRDWHGPRWEFSGENKTFDQWLTQDSKGHLT
jgi:hypothetical protein